MIFFMYNLFLFLSYFVYIVLWTHLRKMFLLILLQLMMRFKDPKIVGGIFTKYFVKACLDQVTKGERVGTCFTKKEWPDIISQFNGLSGMKYNNAKLKNRYDNLSKKWKV